MNSKTLLLLLLISTKLISQPTSWVSRGPGGGGAIIGLSISPFNGNEFYLTCDMSDLFHSTDFGQNYTMTPFTQLQVQLKSEVQFTANSSKLFVLNKPGGYVPVKSYDNGTTWVTATNPCFSSAFQMYANPYDTDQVVLSDKNKIYFTNNENIPLSYSTLFNYPGSYGVHPAGVFFQNKDTVYVCSQDSLKYTFNGGANWQILPAGNTGIPANEHIISFKGAQQGNKWVFYCVTIQSNVLSNIYNSSSRDCNLFKGIYRLSQGQNQWVSKTTNLQTPLLDKGYLLGMATHDTSVLYVAGNSTYLGVTLGAVFKSVNGGNSFNTVFLTQGMFQSNTNITTGWGGAQLASTSKFKWNGLNYILSMAVDPNNSGRLICGDGMWAHTSIDYGNNWKQAYTDSNYENAPSALLNDTTNYITTGLETTASYWLTWMSPQNIFSSYNDILARRSNDGGHHWNFNIQGLDSSKINDVNMTLFKPSNNKLYAACGEVSGSNGDYTDARAVWSKGRISVSADSGKTWTTLKSFGHAVTSVALDPTTANGMYATVMDAMGGIGDVYHCVDVVTNSNTWIRLTSPPRTQNRALQVLVLNDGSLVSVYGPRDNSATSNPTYIFSNSSGVFYSTNGGITWADSNIAAMQKEVNSLEIDPNDPTQNTWLAFVGNKSSVPGVYRTTNRGLTWNLVYNQGVLSGTFHPTLPNTMYICTEFNGLLYATGTNSNSFVPTSVTSYPFRRPQKVFFNPYDVNEVWVASFGNGFRVGNIIVAGNPLPVELISFTGYNKEKNNYLEWLTASEAKNRRFEIERSEDAFSFIKVGELSGHGNSSSITPYSFTDVDVPLGRNYYRLRQVDFNGNTTYSKNILIKNPSSGFEFEVYPVPFKESFQLKIYSEKEIKTTALLYNTEGKILWQQAIRSTDNSIQTHNLSKGIYYLKVMTDDEIKISKLVKY